MPNVPRRSTAKFGGQQPIARVSKKSTCAIRQTSNEVQKSSGCCTALYFKEEIINFIKHIHRY